jgi:hypothetical protein
LRTGTTKNKEEIEDKDTTKNKETFSDDELVLLEEETEKRCRKGENKKAKGAVLFTFTKLVRPALEHHIGLFLIAP